jgi:hypothetical protein
MDLEILTYSGVGLLRLGMTSEQAQDIFGRKPEMFQKTTDTLVENYGGIHLYYDANAKINFIEILRPNRPTFDGLELIGKDIDEISEEFRKRGYGLKNVFDTYQYDDIGVALFVPNSIIKCVSVYVRGYYDE